MINIITYKGKLYPKFQTEGHASKFAIPFAEEVCCGEGFDIGCMKKEWALPGAIPIDIIFNDGWSATKLPKSGVDYIFSSHCLEHLPDWVSVLDYWTTTLRVGGTLFLYLPDYSQEYWRPWNNRKHLNIFTPQIIEDYMIHNNYTNIFKSGVDLNNAFMVIGEKN